MSSNEPGAEVPPQPLEATHSNSNIEGSGVERLSGTDDMENQATYSKSISMDTVDDNNDEGTVKNDSPPGRKDVPSESQSPKQGEDADKEADNDTKTPNPDDEDEDEDEDISTWLREHPRSVKVSWSDYEAFKNRFSPEEGHEIIQVLEGHPDQLRTEILRERSKRRRKKYTASRGKREAENDGSFIHRVRIQSPAIYYVLARLTGQDVWDDLGQPLVFLRPFQIFYYSFPYAKQVLKILERRVNEDHKHGGDLTTYTGPLHRLEGMLPVEIDDPLQKLSMPSDIDMEDIIYGIPDFKYGATSNLTAIEHLRLYIDFVEKNIVPMWVEAKGSTKYKVRFSDLPMYYRPGDILYEPHKVADDKSGAGKTGTDSAGTGGHAVHQNFWKLCYARFQEPAPPQQGQGNAFHIERMMDHVFRLNSFHVDYDGNSYGPLSGDVDIVNFEGEMDIRKLVVYPIRFNSDAPQTLKDLTSRAQNFHSYVQKLHLSYDGWTLIHETYSKKLSRNEKRAGVEHIEGEIMIDFKEGFQSESGFLKPSFGLPEEPSGSSVTSFDPLLPLDFQVDMPTRWWSDKARSKAKGFRADNFLLFLEPFAAFQRSHMIEEDKVLRAYEEDEMVFEFGTYIETYSPMSSHRRP